MWYALGLKTEAPNTQCGAFWSMIQPNGSGLTMPPRLKPVETIPKARPAAPGGAYMVRFRTEDGASFLDAPAA